jgi:hypothetical protein
LKIAFYKAWVKGDLKDKLISIWTLGPYSHCELIFSDGISFSSSWRDDGIGVRYKEIYYLPNRWDFIEIPTTDQELKMRSWCDARTEEKAKYDWRGIIQFVIPFIKQNDEDWFCSEICIAALNHGGVLDWSTFNSPNSFYKLLKQRWPASV